MKWNTVYLQLAFILMDGNILLEVYGFVASRSLGGRSRSTNVKVTVNDNSDDTFDIPEPRWVCPPHIDICAETGVTLSRYMKEMVRVNPDLEEIESSALRTKSIKQSVLSFFYYVSPFTHVIYFFLP